MNAPAPDSVSQRLVKYDPDGTEHVYVKGEQPPGDGFDYEQVQQGLWHRKGQVTPESVKAKSSSTSTKKFIVTWRQTFIQHMDDHPEQAAGRSMSKLLITAEKLTALARPSAGDLQGSNGGWWSMRQLRKYLGTGGSTESILGWFEEHGWIKVRRFKNNIDADQRTLVIPNHVAKVGKNWPC